MTTGQCSISIDVNVIQKMMQDTSYATGVKGFIEASQTYYSEYERETKQCGMRYTSVSIEDDNGRIMQGIIRSMLPYSTENELLSLKTNSNADSYTTVIAKQITRNTDLYEHLMEMFDKSKERQKEMIKNYYNDCNRA